MCTFNLEKYLHRGYIKEVMKNRGIRTINLDNYLIWKGLNPHEIVKFPVKTLRIDLLNGYLYLMDRNNKIIANEETTKLYDETYKIVNELFENETLIPYKIKRNILVKINR